MIALERPDGTVVYATPTAARAPRFADHRRRPELDKPTATKRRLNRRLAIR